MLSLGIYYQDIGVGACVSEGWGGGGTLGFDYLLTTVLVLTLCCTRREDSEDVTFKEPGTCLGRVVRYCTGTVANVKHRFDI